MTINFDNAVSDVNDMGSFYATDIDQGAERLVTIAAGLRHIGSGSEVLYTDHLGETSATFSFAMTGDSANQTITVTGRNAKITSLPAPPLSGDSRVIIRPTWTLHDGASSGAIDIAVANASSTHNAN